MSDLSENYATDKMVTKIGSAGKRLSSAKYVYTFEEASEKFYAVIHELRWIMDIIPVILLFKGDIKYAVSAGSASPFQVSSIGDGVFVVLIDEMAFYSLLTLSLRIQSLPPLAELIKTEEKIEEIDYNGKYLIDITKDIVFNRSLNHQLITGNVQKSVYRSALTFIIGHEVAHVAHGHLEFQQSPQFSEIFSDDSDLNLTLRTLEMDADASATSSVFSVFESMVGSPEYCDSLSCLEEANLTMRRQYVLGSYIALVYLDTLSSNFNPSRHPITYARFLIAQGVFQRIFSRRCPEASGIPEEIRKALIDAFVRLSGNLEGLGHPMATNVLISEEGNSPVALYNDFGIAAGQAHLLPLLGRWARLRPHLEPFVRGGKLAPSAAEPF